MQRKTWRPLYRAKQKCLVMWSYRARCHRCAIHFLTRSTLLPTTTDAEGAETKSAPAVPARPPLWMRATAARNAAAAAGSGDGTALAGAQPLRPPPPLTPPLLPEQLDRAGHHGSAEDDEVSPGSSHVKEKPDPVGVEKGCHLRLKSHKTSGDTCSYMRQPYLRLPHAATVHRMHLL